jgi:glutathione S-transferase
MKLFYSAASPYVRKVMVAAHETGLAVRIELVPSAASPVDRNRAIAEHNPAGRVPTLVADDGSAIFDSRVICEHLDRLHDGAPLIPREPADRIRTLTLNALADGLLEAGVLSRYETVMRPQELRWQAWIDGQRGKIEASLDSLDGRWIGHLESRLDLGGIAAGCALGWLDFRFAEVIDWRASRPRLAAWYEGVSARPSMAATVPKA